MSLSIGLEVKTRTVDIFDISQPSKQGLFYFNPRCSRLEIWSSIRVVHSVQKVIVSTCSPSCGTYSSYAGRRDKPESGWYQEGQDFFFKNLGYLTTFDFISNEIIRAKMVHWKLLLCTVQNNARICRMMTSFILLLCIS